MPHSASKPATCSEVRPARGGPGHRQKRTQVVRACDWCRQHRAKCDNQYPCLNCRNRNRQCSNEVLSATTLPVAQREIDRLRQRVHELELQVSQDRDKAADSQYRYLYDSSLSPPELLHGADGVLEPGNISQKGSWDGILMRTARSPHKTWYGPSSLFFFMGRINKFLNATTPQQAHSPDAMILNSASRQVDEPGAAPHISRDQHAPNSTDSTGTPLSPKATYVSPTQEEYFLDFFWQTYHTSLFPIVDEAEFKSHYRSLWTASGNMRQPSPLVDILVAMCMQYGMSMQPEMKLKLSTGNEDATMAGRWHYRRCRALLAHELESPTISTLQCHLLCCIYLCAGSFQNMADSTCALAVRTAYMLGLHMEPPQAMPQREREIRKRLWWALYILDTKIGMKLGRPFLLPHASSNTPSLPRDHLEIAMDSGSNFAPLGNNVTWLSFNLQHLKLFQAARSVHIAFYSRDLGIKFGSRIWEDSEALAAHAQFFSPYMKVMEEWASGVPEALQIKRQKGDRPFSTNRSKLDMEEFSPLWLQRQRLLLELWYHHICISLCRPFISFGPHCAPAKEMAETCARHAMALTAIMHEILTSGTLLSAWHEAFQLQWSAAITLVGFVLAYPRGTLNVEARKAVDLSVAIFDIFGKSFTVAISASKIICDLGTKAGFLTQQQKQQGQKRTASIAMNESLAHSLSGVGSEMLEQDYSMPEISTMSKTWDGALNIDELSAASMQDVFNMALAVDEWSDLRSLWPSTDQVTTDQFAIAQY